jgi:bifunctional DNase/RNase
MHQEMTVFGFSLDSLTSKPMVILKNAQDDTTLPIWISSSEAFAIAAQLVNWDSPAGGKGRDLMALFLEKTGTEIGSIAIGDLNDGGFAASVTFLRGVEEILVEVRPSEAIIASITHRKPVLVAEEVLQRASLVAVNSEEIAGEHNARRFAEFLENLDPASLGKYPM